MFRRERRDAAKDPASSKSWVGEDGVIAARSDGQADATTTADDAAVDVAVDVVEPDACFKLLCPLAPPLTCCTDPEFADTRCWN